MCVCVRIGIAKNKPLFFMIDMEHIANRIEEKEKEDSAAISCLSFIV